MTPAQLTLDLPHGEAGVAPASVALAPGALVLRRFVSTSVEESALLADLWAVAGAAPFRHLVTPGGFRMSVAMTNCGSLGWFSDGDGYRYTTIDPDSGAAWPALPASFLRLATAAAARAGFPGFAPDACLVNRYEPGTRLTLHQDKNERDLSAPIVSVSLGLPAVFLFGGLSRRERPARVPLHHGDVVVWGGPARLRYHGIANLPEGHHAQLGARRINLTFRRAG
jgi:alkylated DNA repair protein (DNA oxidative demethylase)